MEKQSPPPVSTRPNWASFSASPHRLFFWGGVTFSVWAMLLWGLQLTSLYTSFLSPWKWVIPYPQAHGFMVMFGLFGFYFFGFLLTTFPRWLSAPPIPRKLYLFSWFFLMGGVHLFWVGLFIHQGLVVAAIALVMVGYAAATGGCIWVLFSTQSPDTMQQKIIAFGLLTGIFAMGAMIYGLTSGDYRGYWTARHLGVYPFLLLVILTVAYRMVPFFSTMVSPGSELRRSRFGVYGFFIACWVRGLLPLAGMGEYAWLAEGALFIILIHELIVWRFWRMNFPPLLLILYLALFWMLVSFALSVGEGVYTLVTGGFPPFGNAALHALTVGGFGSLLLGISSRVTLGHSGVGLSTAPKLVALFFGFQIIPFMRVLPEVLGFWFPSFVTQNYWSGFAWSLLFGLWFVFFGGTLLRPRSDGKPG